MTQPTASHTILSFVFAIMVAAAAPTAQSAAPAVTGVSGAWKVSLHGQHIIPVGMELKQDGAKVTGTMMLWNGDVDLDGEIVNGTFKVSGRLEPTDGTPAGDRIITATVQPDGTLEGSFAGDHGSIKLTAERFTDRPARRAAPPAAAPHGVASAPASGAAPASAFAGKWRLSTGSGTETRTLNLEVLVADGTVSGTVTTDHAGPLAIQQGRIADGALTFAIPMGASALVQFTATLKDHASLTGSIAGAMGPMTFVGERVQ